MGDLSSIFCFWNCEQLVGSLWEFYGAKDMLASCYNIGTARNERRKTMEIQSSLNCKSQQMLLAYAMLQSGRSLEELLEEYGISEEEFTSWILDDSFAECAGNMTSRMSGIYAPYMLHSLVETAMKGSVPAIKLYFELFDVHGIFGRKSRRAVTASAEIETLRADIFEGDGS